MGCLSLWCKLVGPGDCDSQGCIKASADPSAVAKMQAPDKLLKDASVFLDRMTTHNGLCSNDSIICTPFSDTNPHVSPLDRFDV